MPSARDDKRKRAVALEAFEAAVEACDPAELIRRILEFSEKTLRIKGNEFKARRVLVIGAGKASGAMAEALDNVVPVEAGVVAVPIGIASRFATKKIVLMEATHPYPSEKSVAAAKAMLALAKRVRNGDVVVCLVSGGGSALLEMPKKGISVGEVSEVSKLLMHAGAGINELNTVRQCLSAVKGGKLAAAFAEATVVNLVVSDVLGSPLEIIASGPTVRCRATPSEARKIIAKYGLENTDAGRKGVAVIKKMPDEHVKMPEIDSFILADNDFAVDKATEFLRRRGLKPVVMKRVKGEARAVGKALAKLVNRGSCFVAGGETIVTVRGKGKGGRSQELALAAAMHLKRGVLLSAGTDGIDGNSDAAGAIVDSTTADKARKKGLDARGYLKDNDSNTFFRKLGNSLIKTGPTGTNVCDLIIGIP